MQAVKAVKQGYAPSLQLLELLDKFRKMVNDCIRISLKGVAGEAVKRNLEKRKEQVILGVDATQLNLQPKT